MDETRPELIGTEPSQAATPSDLDRGAPTIRLGKVPAPVVPPAHLPAIPGYVILEEVGRGGMGVVYKARQVALNRTVALKVILTGAFSTPEDRDRFRREAEAIARLQHPNIVQIFDIGTHEGVPYFSLEFVDGEPLDRKLRRVHLPARETAALVATVARAIHGAHRQGVIHRDLKPGNVLVARDGTPKIADFGLAKRFGPAARRGTGEGGAEEDPSSHTTTTRLLAGTPQYMAPEQARNRPGTVGPPADIYALGAILYELLTGRPPFDSPLPMVTLRQVLDEEPVPPRWLNPSLPRDLETVTLKCLQKDPAERYGSAEELADDLRRWLENEPVRARPSGPAERAVKWARRQPTQAALAASALLVVVLTAVGGATGWLWWRAEKSNRANQQTLETLAREQEQTAAALKREEEALARESDLVRRLKQLSYLHRIELAAREYHDGQVARARGRLADCPPELRNWEWYHLDSLVNGKDGAEPAAPIDGSTGPVADLDFSRDGRALAVAGRDGAVAVFDPVTRQEIVRLPHAGEVHVVRFSGDGTRLLTAYDRPRLWDVRTGRQLWSPDGWEDHECRAAALSPDGRFVAAAGSWARLVRVWDAADGRVRFELPGHRAEVRAVAYSPDGRLLATAGDDHTVRLWDATDGRALATLKGHTRPVRGVAFSRDGGRLASGGDDHTVRVWDVASGREEHVLTGHAQEVLRLAFARDGDRLFSAGPDRTVRVWDVAAGQEVLVLPVPDGSCFALAADPSRGTVAGGGGSARVYLWQAPRPDSARVEN